MIISSRRVRTRTVAFAVSAILATSLLAWTGVLDRGNARLFDRIFQLRNRFVPQPDPGVLVEVDIDDASLVAMNGNPGRAHLAAAVRTLADARVAAQAYDFVLAGPKDASDHELASAARRAGRVYVGAVAETPPDSAVLSPRLSTDGLPWKLRAVGDVSSLATATAVVAPFDGLRGSVAGIGVLNALPDADGVFRRVPLLTRYGGGYYPALALTVACGYLGVTPDRVTLSSDRITLHEARVPGRQPRDVEIPIDRDGAMQLNFRGAWESGPHVRFSQLWHDSLDPTAGPLIERTFHDRIALVADVTTGQADIGPVPIDPAYPLAGLHATAIRNIVESDFVSSAPAWTRWAIEVSAIAMLFVLSLRRPRWLWAGAAAGVVAIVTLGAIVFVMAGTVLNVGEPLSAVVMFSVSSVAWRFLEESRQRELTRRAFESYFPPVIVDRLLANETQVAGSRQREITVLFSDIVGFTARSSRMAPDEVREFLSRYFSRMVSIVFRHGGTVDKFIGDGLMVFFNDPEDQPDHAERCVRCAIGMQAELRAWSRESVARGEPEVRVRIGVNTGPAIVGDLGSADRLSYTAVGSTVNLAQRLESAAPPGGILISAETAARLPAAIATSRAPDVQPKGFDSPVKIFLVELPSAQPEVTT